MFGFVVAFSDLLYDVDAMHGLCYLLKESGNIFLNMSDARGTANCSFTGITRILEKIYRYC